MPHVTLKVGPIGPEISVIISAIALCEGNAKTVKAVAARLIIDTGATLTQIDKGLLEKLNIEPCRTGQIDMAVGGSHTVNQYEVAIRIPGITAGSILHSVDKCPVIEGHFSGKGIDGLLGRDILARCRMTYSGPEQVVFLSF